MSIIAYRLPSNQIELWHSRNLAYEMRDDITRMDSVVTTQWQGENALLAAIDGSAIKGGSRCKHARAAMVVHYVYENQLP